MYSLTLIIAAGLSAAGADPVPFYADKLDLTCYLEPSGERRPIASAADWAIRRAHVRAGFQQVAGPLPSREHPGPIDLQVAMGREWPARTEQLDGLGHSPNVDDPAALVEALLRGW